jgi:hypothetical protein
VNTYQILKFASQQITALEGRTLDILDVARPSDIEYAKHLAKVVSKLSPILGNTIEYSIVKHLNETGSKLSRYGKWARQDPGFPDAAFIGSINPQPGVEIKTWFPLATEITARFRESVTHFADDNVNVALVAWIPEHILFGKPKINAVWIDSALSMAQARDTHYHNPPDYLVIEPLDTSTRTSNLQQTNALGYKFQGTPKQFAAAEQFVSSWGRNAKQFSYALSYQRKLARLMGSFGYRLDTNFAKIDRIQHPSLEAFKTQVLGMRVNGHSLREWASVVADEDGLSQLIHQEELLKDLV